VKILFLHGRHSVPGGVRPSYLARDGHEVINPALVADAGREILAPRSGA